MSGNLFIDNKIKQIPITEAELMKTCFTWIYFLGFSGWSCDYFMIHLKIWREIYIITETLPEIVFYFVNSVYTLYWSNLDGSGADLCICLAVMNSSNFIIRFTTWYSGFPGGSGGKVSACNAGDLGSIPGSGRSPGEGNGNLLQYSCLENSMDRGA